MIKVFKPYSLRPTQFVPPSDGTVTNQIDLNAAVSASASIDKHILSVTQCKRESDWWHKEAVA